LTVYGNQRIDSYLINFGGLHWDNQSAPRAGLVGYCLFQLDAMATQKQWRWIIKVQS